MNDSRRLVRPRGARPGVPPWAVAVGPILWALVLALVPELVMARERVPFEARAGLDIARAAAL